MQSAEIMSNLFSTGVVSIYLLKLPAMYLTTTASLVFTAGNCKFDFASKLM